MLIREASACRSARHLQNQQRRRPQARSGLGVNKHHTKKFLSVDDEQQQRRPHKGTVAARVRRESTVSGKHMRQ